MKKITVYASFTIFIAILLFLVFPQIVRADIQTNVTENDNGANSQSDVSVSTNTGNNTICQNGNCTTTSNGNGQSTVCINGQCQTSSGDINVSENNGNDQVHINNSTGSQPTETPNPTSNPTVSPAPSTNVSPTQQPSPTPAVLSLNIHMRHKTIHHNSSWFANLNVPLQDLAAAFYFIV